MSLSLVNSPRSNPGCEFFDHVVLRLDFVDQVQDGDFCFEVCFCSFGPSLEFRYLVFGISSDSLLEYGS